MRRARQSPSRQDDSSTVSVTCTTDGRSHQVPDQQLAAPDADHPGRYRALCGHVVIAAALAEPEGTPCSLCAER